MYFVLDYASAFVICVLNDCLLTYLTGYWTNSYNRPTYVS